MPNTTPASYGGPSWKILNANPASGPSSSGGFTRGWDVTYQLRNGKSGTVFVPGDSFNTDAVKAAVAEQAGMLDAVLNLTSDT